MFKGGSVMSTLLFVHGTGVRRESFAVTYQLIHASLRARLPDCHVRPCYWGDLGASLHFGGDSIPDYQSSKYGGVPDDLIFWTQLYNDPLLELRMLSVPTIDGRAPPEADEGSRLARDAIGYFRFEGALKDRLQQTGQLALWQSALQQIEREPDVEKSFASGHEPRMVLEALSRAIAALAISQAKRIGLPTIDGSTRDELVAKLSEDLAKTLRKYESEMGSPAERVKRAGQAISSFYSAYVSNPAKRYATRVATSLITQGAVERRKSLTDFSSPIAGDILLYQARGARIREAVLREVAACGEPPFILAHSLGGVIAVDLLAMSSPPKVAGLITVGSQAPYLYEIGALAACEPPNKLPVAFPKWLNFYDPNDLLSFKAESIFPGVSRDVRIESKQPFPESHGAYWSIGTLWDQCAHYIRGA